jgi:AhpD family alkylhydroperoxidase
MASHQILNARENAALHSACHIRHRRLVMVLNKPARLEKTMSNRVSNPYKAAPEAIKAMMAVEAALRASGLEHSLLELVKMRASQMNGCAFCIHMHATEARAAGERAILAENVVL